MSLEAKVNKLMDLQWKNTHEHLCSFVLTSKVTLKEIKDIEEVIGKRLPEDYVWFVTKIGLFYIHEKLGKMEWKTNRMLSPQEMMITFKSFQSWIAEDDFGDEPDEIDYAISEQKIRSQLLPFQYIGDGSATDVYCFSLSESNQDGNFVVAAYHDDYELSIVWEKRKKMSLIYGFSNHFLSWATSVIEEDIL